VRGDSEIETRNLNNMHVWPYEPMIEFR